MTNTSMSEHQPPTQQQNMFQPANQPVQKPQQSRYTTFLVLPAAGFHGKTAATQGSGKRSVGGLSSSIKHQAPMI